MANSVNPDQTSPIGAVCSGSTLFAYILNSSVKLGNYLQQTILADDIFRCIFGGLRVKTNVYASNMFSLSAQSLHAKKAFHLHFGPFLLYFSLLLLPTMHLTSDELRNLKKNAQSTAFKDKGRKLL